jgi:hypothetical protein
LIDWKISLRKNTGCPLPQAAKRIYLKGGRQKEVGDGSTIVQGFNDGSKKFECLNHR